MNLPRIQVDPNNPSRFRNSVTLRPFTPIGNNYVARIVEGVTVDFNTGLYDPVRAETALTRMQASGYNIVRVIVQFRSIAISSVWHFGVGGLESSTSPLLFGPYLANLFDFIRRANTHGIYVIPVLSFVPYTHHYQALLNEPAPNISGYARFYLSQGGIAAKVVYLDEFVRALRAYDPGLLSTIFSYELENELSLSGDEMPFSLKTGFVQTADGISYDMADRTSRQQAFDSNVVNWADRCADSIRHSDPEAMVSVSVFTYLSVQKNSHNGLMLSPSVPIEEQDLRFPGRPAILNLFSRGISFIDVHFYPSSPSYVLKSDLRSSELLDMPALKPRIVGEFGAPRALYSSAQDAADALKLLRSRLRRRGFVGSLLWTWNCPKTPWNRHFFATEKHGVINEALRPR